MAELKNILYVEDDPDIQTIAKLALETIGGFNVNVCSSGQEALENAEKFRPQLLLLDVMMPIMDGHSTLAALRKIPALIDVPAIFMTAKIQTHEINEYREQGILEIINKPFDPILLAEQISKIWKQQIR
ncbi:Two-component response regulator [hydrothermal vent metagenome]|uniref:Two-component response regulator n=1 Tax=hydrothermal vent metagenome TaxID=652676 RepID=A0A3B1AVC3_9ZZZZ